MDEKRIERINELYHKSKKEGLTKAEKKEQAELRKEYILSIRRNMEAQLDHVTVVHPDGSTVDLKKKRKKKV